MPEPPDREPWLDAESDEALQRQFHLARLEGDAYGAALEELMREHGDVAAQQRTGDYWIGYTIGAATGQYEWVEDELRWRDAPPGQVHVAITVRDTSDGRFVPGAGVTVTIADEGGTDFGTLEHPLVWHPTVYHYGGDWRLAADQAYTLTVRVEPPRFNRQDRTNGWRLNHAAEAKFAGVRVDPPPDPAPHDP